MIFRVEKSNWLLPWVLLIWLCSHQLEPLPAIAQDSALDDVQRFYQLGDYRNALSASDRALAKDDRNATVHYYRANCLFILGRGPDAKTEYRQAIRLTADAQLKEYCQVAIKELRLGNKASRGVSFQGNQRRWQAAADGSVAAERQDDAIQELSAVKSVVEKNSMPVSSGLEKNLERSKNGLNAHETRISEQADESSRGILQEGAIARDLRTKDGQDAANSILNQAERTASRMAASYYYDKYGNAYPVYTQKDIESVRQKGEDDARNSLSNALREADEALQSAHKRAYETEVSAASLKNQLRQSRPGSVHLVGTGTNLYVRNYTTDFGSPEPNPAQVSVADRAQAGKGANLEPLEATPRSLDSAIEPGAKNRDGRSSTSDVFGKLLQKTGP
jgi:tetratricopeptide (TPR) repeat protein